MGLLLVRELCLLPRGLDRSTAGEVLTAFSASPPDPKLASGTRARLLQGDSNAGGPVECELSPPSLTSVSE